MSRGASGQFELGKSGQFEIGTTTRSMGDIPGSIISSVHRPGGRHHGRLELRGGRIRSDDEERLGRGDQADGHQEDFGLNLRLQRHQTLLALG